MSAFSCRESVVLSGRFVVAARVELGVLLCLLPLDGVIDLTPMDGDALGGGNAQADLAAANIDDSNFHLITDHNGFIC